MVFLKWILIGVGWILGYDWSGVELEKIVTGVGWSLKQIVTGVGWGLK